MFIDSLEITPNNFLVLTKKSLGPTWPHKREPGRNLGPPLEHYRTLPHQQGQQKRPQSSTSFLGYICLFYLWCNFASKGSEWEKSSEWTVEFSNASCCFYIFVWVLTTHKQNSFGLCMTVAFLHVKACFGFAHNNARRDRCTNRILKILFFSC